MDTTAKLFEFLWAIVLQLPSLITIVVCLAFVAKRRRRFPKISLAPLIGLVLAFLSGLVFAVVFTWVPALFSGSAAQETVYRVYFVLGLLNYGAAAITFLCLLVAVFIGREPAPEH